MRLVPSYNNGVDPEIRETGLPHPMRPGEWNRRQVFAAAQSETNVGNSDPRKSQAGSRVSKEAAA